MTDKRTAPPTADPVEARAREIKAGWEAKEDREMMDRARGLARQQIDREERAAHDAIPANWAQRMAKAGVTSVALTWPGAPVAPSLCLPQGRRWSIDPEGAWYAPEGHERQFVASPVVAGPGAHEFSASDGQDWFTISVPPPDVPTGNGHRVTPQAYVELVVERLRRAGVTFGRTIDRSTRDVSDVVDAARYAAIWLLGVGSDGSIGNRPTALLADALAAATADWRPDTPEGKQALGAVLTRHPGVW